MRAVTEAELSAYYRHIEKLIATPKNEKKKILCGFQSGIHEYLDLHPNATFEEIQNHFGTPEELATAYVPEVPQRNLKKLMRTKRIILILAAILIVTIIVLIFAWNAVMDATPGIIKETGRVKESSSSTIAVEQYEEEK